MPNQIDYERSIEVNKKIVRAEVRQLEKRMWERSRFCQCGAESVLECECDKDKRRRYMKRVSRKVNEEYGKKAMRMMVGSTMKGS